MKPTYTDRSQSLGSRYANLAVGVLCSITLLVFTLLPQEASAATGTCSPATGQGTGPADYATYCWIDFTNYNDATARGAGGQAFTITLPGGSTLSFTLSVTTSSLTAIAVPTWTGAAFGQSAFTGVPGKPALYQTTNGTTTNVTISNIVLTVGSGTVPYALVAADAESTNNGESLSFTTNGDPWTLLATMPQGGVYPTLGGVGTATVTETGVAGTVGAYAFATTGSPTTISSVVVGGGLQGIAFAVKFHAVDFAITSTPSGSFAAGGTGTYTLGVSSNGPDTYSSPDAITVTDTLPTGLTYNPAGSGGTGWTCGATGQVVTCTVSNVTIASGGTLPNITVNVTLANTIASSVTNTTTVASNPNLDFNSANNTATNVTTIVEPDLSTSTKAVVNTGGGDAVVGSTLQYTITLSESAGAVAAGVSVTDDVPANLSGFTVTSFPAGSTNSSTGAGTGANNDGQVNITGITVPTNGSVTIVFTAQVAAGTVNCTTIDNTATVTNPNGPGATPSSNTIVVAQSSCTASGNKILYLYDNTGPTYTNLLNRVVQTVNSVVANEITVGRGTNHVWDMNPAVATGKSLVLPAGNVTVTLIETATGVNTGTNRPTTVTLLNNGVAVATSGTVNVRNGPTAYNYTIAIPATTVLAGNPLGIQFNNNTGTNNRNIAIAQKTAAQGNSKLTFATSTVINVDSVTAYNAVYPATTTTAVYVPNNTVYICAVISDPFGSADVTSATITLTDPNGTVQVSAAAMTAKGATDCAGTANAADEAFEYTYAIPSSAATGFWTATVTGNEGSEGTVTHTANGSFDVDVPSLLIMKTVSVTSDPVEGATRSKALPGATVQYTILVQNNGRGPVDTGTFVISDPVPANTVMSLPAKPPFTFTNGATSSGLSVTAGSDANITYSNNGGTTFAYVPACTRPCTDAAITNFKITLTGSMNGKTGGTAPSFTITYNVVIQ